MLYRPRFCSECGEKIERAVWHAWTSRRFCDVCVADNAAAEYVPKAAMIIAFVATIAGFTAYFAPKQNVSVAKLENTRNEKPVIASLVATPMPTPVIAATLSAAPVAKAEKPVVIEQDTNFVCGAETKKGAPCSRRVKGKVRCFQHQGMPAMSTIASQGK